MTTDENNLFQAQLLIEELRRHGVTRFVVCPGSRSTPLVLALSMDDRVECVVHHDERGAGYYAVGYARATGRAAAVVTTSGTAAVNLHPAIVEASQDNLPMVALTADRPPELHTKGVNQTIEQKNLFGSHVRFAADVLCPDDIEATDSLILVDQACSHLTGGTGPVGPVHINCKYREPLVPSPDKLKSYRQIIESNHSELQEWLNSKSPYDSDSMPAVEPDTTDLSEIARIVQSTKRGLLLVGHLRSEVEQKAVTEFIGKLGWPTIADITSGLASTQQTLIVNHHDLILASLQFTQSHAPDTILHVGGRLTSKRLLQFIEHVHPMNYIFNAGGGIIYDPVSAVTRRTNYDTGTFCQQLSRQLATSSQESVWCETWRAASEKCQQVVSKSCEGTNTLTEPALAHLLSHNITEAAAFFLASSMPIRDMDMFAALKRALPVAANRGASGIDGTIASACGYADGLNRPVTLLIGDQAFLHDLSSLQLLVAINQPVILVVVNNHGGHIFEQLPVVAHHKVFDRFFVAPHNLTFEKIAKTFGIDYTHVSDLDSFNAAYGKASVSKCPSIIEAAVDPTVSREHRHRIINEVKAKIDSLITQQV